MMSKRPSVEEVLTNLMGNSINKLKLIPYDEVHFEKTKSPRNGTHKILVGVIKPDAVKVYATLQRPDTNVVTIQFESGDQILSLNNIDNKRKVVLVAPFDVLSRHAELLAVLKYCFMKNGMSCGELARGRLLKKRLLQACNRYLPEKCSKSMESTEDELPGDLHPLFHKQIKQSKGLSSNDGSSSGDAFKVDPFQGTYPRFRVKGSKVKGIGPQYDNSQDVTAKDIRIHIDALKGQNSEAKTSKAESRKYGENNTELGPNSPSITPSQGYREVVSASVLRAPSPAYLHKSFSAGQPDRDGQRKKSLREASPETMIIRVEAEAYVKQRKKQRRLFAAIQEWHRMKREFRIRSEFLKKLDYGIYLRRKIDEANHDRARRKAREIRDGYTGPSKVAFVKLAKHLEAVGSSKSEVEIESENVMKMAKKKMRKRKA